jgi:large subunit ribosomal protein L17
MRHRKTTIKLGRSPAHRHALLSSLVCNLIQRSRIQTTLPKAKAARSLADRMVTLGKRGTLAARRAAIARLHRPAIVGQLFAAVAPSFAERKGGYTRILRLGRRASDSAEMAILEWTNYAPPAPKAKKEKKAGPAQDKDAGGKK